MKRRSRSIRAWIFGGSVALHAAFAVAAVVIPNPERAETVAIELADIKKKKEPPKPPPPPPPPPPQDKPKPPPPPPKAASQAKVTAEAAKIEATPQSLMPMGEDGFADLGSVAIGNAGGGEGVAIPTGPVTKATTAAGAGPRPAKAVMKKAVEQLAAGPDVCTQPVVRPKRTVGVQAKYTKQAQLAEIEGKVRVEVTVDESGHVIAARLLSGLGYGLDELAIEAAKKCVFEPATLCGRPVVGTTVVTENFELE